MGGLKSYKSKLAPLLSFAETKGREIKENCHPREEESATRKIEGGVKNKEAAKIESAES